jgi:branched-subunit amino acid ABC-type transport system permease component
MTFSLFFQSLINGLNQGAIYALIALGYTMVYGIIRMINFAHGDFIMIGAYTLFYTIPYDDPCRNACLDFRLPCRGHMRCGGSHG